MAQYWPNAGQRTADQCWPSTPIPTARYPSSVKGRYRPCLQKLMAFHWAGAVPVPAQYLSRHWADIGPAMQCCLGK